MLRAHHECQPFASHVIREGARADLQQCGATPGGAAQHQAGRRKSSNKWWRSISSSQEAPAPGSHAELSHERKHCSWFTHLPHSLTMAAAQKVSTGEAASLNASDIFSNPSQFAHLPHSLTMAAAQKVSRGEAASLNARCSPVFELRCLSCTHAIHSLCALASSCSQR